jgi:hypothetical protein
MIMAQKFQFGQWTLEVDEAAGTYEFYNRDLDTGVKRFFRVVPGPYSAPRVEPEPELAFGPPNLKYQNAKGQEVVPDEKISGIICQGGIRASLSNLKSKGIAVTVNTDGSLQVGDEVWWLATLFSKDKNRFLNYDAYLVRNQPDVVTVLELGDMNLFG